MPEIGGETLRAWRRSRGWDAPETARQLRKAAGNDPMPVHDALVRMIYRWERAWGSTQDTIKGVLLVRGARGGLAADTPLRAITSYYPNASDLAQIVQSNHWRVSALAQAFAGWAPRELGL